MMKRALKITGILAGLLVIMLLILLGRVDNTPYFDAPYYDATIHRLESAVANQRISKGQVFLGFSKVNITPSESQVMSFTEEDIPLAGYGKREGAPATGVHDSLYIKALAVRVSDQTMVLVGVDLLIMPPNIVEKVDSILSISGQITRDQIFYTATHTHASVGGWSSNYVGRSFAGEPNPELVDWLAEKFALAVTEAIKKMEPGRIGHGVFDASDLVRNRLLGEKGREHGAFHFLLAETNSEEKALVGFFDAHATTLGGDNMTFSADYPGYWYQRLTSAGIDLPVFCAGSVGSHGPETEGEGFEKPEFLGEELGRRVIAELGNVQLKDSIAVSSLNLVMDLPEFHIRISDGIRLAPFLAQKLFPPLGEVRLQTLMLGDFILTTTPADFSGELAIYHEDELDVRGYSSVISSFNGGYIGYLLPAKYYHYREYESMVMSWFGPNMGPYMDEMITRMTLSVAPEKQ